MVFLTNKTQYHTTYSMGSSWKPFILRKIFYHVNLITTEGDKMKQDISIKFAGLSIKSPVIVASSGLTGTAAQLKEFEEHGAGAIVLKSIFEEEIHFEYAKELAGAGPAGYSQEDLDYLDAKIKQDNVTKYVQLISEAKETVDIPVIASINCVSSHEWTYFTKKIEQAGADALELNIFVQPSDVRKSAQEIENTYFQIIDSVQKTTSLPLIVKMSHFFTNLGDMIQRVSHTGIDGLVLFNKYFSPDVDLRTKRLTAAGIFSNPQDLILPLRWIAISSGSAGCPLAASTGVHDGEGLVKMILAGAHAVEIASTLYQEGPQQIQMMNDYLASYMESENVQNLDEIRGIVSKEKISNPAVFERVQFMKYFSDRKENS